MPNEKDPIGSVVTHLIRSQIDKPLVNIISIMITTVQKIMCFFVIDEHPLVSCANKDAFRSMYSFF